MDIRIPLDRALDLLVAIPPTSEAVKWLRARIIDAAGGPEPDPEKPKAVLFPADRLIALHGVLDDAVVKSVAGANGAREFVRRLLTHGRRVDDTESRPVDLARLEAALGENPAPWTPKVGERVLVGALEEDPLFGTVVEILRLTGSVGVRVERGGSPITIRYFPPSWVRPAEEAR